MASAAQPQNRVMTFGRKKQAIAVVSAVKGHGMVKVNGVPLNLVQPQQLRTKLMEPVLLIGKSKFNGVNIRVRTRGGGSIAQIYAARQAIAKAIVSYYQKYVDEEQKMQIKDTYMRSDRSLLVTDPRRTECKKFGGGGARSRYTKSYR